ncbi:CDP-alcohol phosphatidyltransferase family protein [Elusimicrobiota bacterium]
MSDQQFPKFTSKPLLWLRHALPSIITLGNLAMGFIIIWVVISEKGQAKYAENPSSFLTLMAGLLLLGAFCDVIDGYVARKLKITSALGVELDSLADLLSFGMAPVVVFYVCFFGEKPTPLTFLACLGYVMAGTFRLARFNHTARDPKSSSSFEGLPITGASLFWAALLLLLARSDAQVFLAEHGIGARKLLVFFFALLGFLMVSHVPYKSLKGVKFVGMNRKYLLLILLITAGLSLLIGPLYVFVSIPIIYVLGIPLVALLRKIFPKKKQEE